MTDTGPHPLTPLPVTVLDRRQETSDTVTLELDPSEAGVRPAAAPGQFHMLWAFGVGEAPISVSAVGEARQAHTIRAVGAVTRALTDVEVGDTVGIRGPYGVGGTSAGRSTTTSLSSPVGSASPPPAARGRGRRSTSRAALRDPCGGGAHPRDLLCVDDLDVWRGGATVLVTADTAGATGPARSVW